MVTRVSCLPAAQPESFLVTLSGLADYWFWPLNQRDEINSKYTVGRIKKAYSIWLRANVWKGQLRSIPF